MKGSLQEINLIIRGSPSLVRKKNKKMKKKEGELTALGTLIGAASDSRKLRKTRYSFHSNLLALLDQICTLMH